MSIAYEDFERLETESLSTKLVYKYCPTCVSKAWLVSDHDQHHEASGIDYVSIEGVAVINEVLTKEDEYRLVNIIDDGNAWVPSQEGRAKQDFGPKVNFLGRKCSKGSFVGFPKFARDQLALYQKSYPKLLKDFIPVEFCLLEYLPERGSYIRPHFDDMWIWGDRLVTVNLLSETVLRLTKEFNIPPYEIAISMPPRSLIVIYGEARYNWHHSIKKFDIKSRRIAMTWREFSDEIMSDLDHADFVNQVLSIASNHNP